MKFSSIFLIGIGILFSSFINTKSVHQEQEKAFMGIFSEKIYPQKAALLNFNNPHGSYISKVVKNSCADKAGFQAFDYLYGINDFRTSEQLSFTAILSRFHAGEEAEIHFIRKGEAMNKSITFGKKMYSPPLVEERNNSETPHLGIRSNGGEYKVDLGVSVAVMPNSTAKEMGIKTGDLIISINGFPIVDWLDVKNAIEIMEVGETIAVEHIRNGETLKSQQPIKSYAETKYSWAVGLSSAFLGIYSDGLSKEKAKKLGFENPYGSYVTKVIWGTAAYRAGIQPFDYIYGIDEYRTGEKQSLGTILRKYRAGDEATLHLIRKKEKTKVSVIFGARETSAPKEVDKCQQPFFGVRLNYDICSDDGICVDIVKNSTAAAIGLQDKDVIISLNDHQILDWDDVTIAISNMKVGEVISVAYLREGEEKEGRYPIKSLCDTKKELDLDMDWNFDIDLGQEKKDAPPSKLNFSDVQSNFSSISQKEAESLKRKSGINASAESTLVPVKMRFIADSDAQDFLLEFQLDKKGDIRVMISNSAMRTIYDSEVIGFPGTFSDLLNISQHGAGIYYLYIEQAGKSYSKKITIK